MVRRRSLRRADHPSRSVLPSVVRLSVIEEPRRGGLGPALKKKKCSYKDALASDMVVLPLLQEVNHITVPLLFEAVSHNLRSFNSNYSQKMYRFYAGHSTSYY